MIAIIQILMKELIMIVITLLRVIIKTKIIKIVLTKKNY